nr:uncharacterized protein LOC109187581 [Ipomoea batatas]GMC56635.1 uncharacterized protein LOC109187581 [Ipomoea batatas]
MADGNDENAMEVAYHTDTNTDEKLRREGKSRSVVWQHFTKLVREDGTYEKCKCNHCNKIFSCSSRSGTTTLLRHVTEGACPVVKLDKKEKLQTNNTSFGNTGGSSEPRGVSAQWKFDHAPIEPPIDMHDELLPEGLPCVYSNGDFAGQTPSPAYGIYSQPPATKSQINGDTWMNEVRACLSKLNKLINEQLPLGTPLKTSSANGAPDTSIATAIKCLNEMGDIPQSSTMYLDALDIIRDPEERECFVYLNPEPRRRWLQRMLHRRHPLSYTTHV